MENNEYYCSPQDKEFDDIHMLPRRHNDDNKVLAKKIFRDDGSVKFMIRINENKDIYNPTDQLKKDTSRRPSSYRNNDIKFVVVGHKVFSLYIKYLQQLQPSWLNLARREMN